MTEFGTILIDPPWAYEKRTGNRKKQKGYATDQYSTITTADLMALPIDELGSKDSVLLLWATWPFYPDALECIKAWGYEYKTALVWVKTDKKGNPHYGVGHWARGAAEPLLIAKRPKGKSYRNNYMGLISPVLGHSQKPESVYEYAGKFPGPHLELFARKAAPNWYALGNEAPGDGKDIRIALKDLIAGNDDWSTHQAAPVKLHRPGSWRATR